MSHDDTLPFAAPTPEELGNLFPGYAVDSLIACGGMGAVYYARQVALDRPVAIKILPRELSSDEEFREGFSAEARAMARLNHPNLIGVYDFGEVDGMLFIIMEFVAGESLYSAAYGKAIDSREVARLMSDICAGVAHAHEHRILHRDIKPANILLDTQARPKIGDFGLARPIGHSTKEGEAIFGTPHYTAPEVTDAPMTVDARADIFSLGVVLHELLTGKLPADDPRPASLISGCPRAFDAIIQKATNPIPGLRYRDVASMGREIAELAKAPTGPQLRPGAAVPKPRRARAVAKKSSGGGGFWLLLLLLAGGGAAYWYTQIYQKQSVVVAPPPVVEVQESFKLPEPPPIEAPPTAVAPGEAPKPEPLPMETAAAAETGVRTTVFGSERPAGPAPIFDVEGFLFKARGIMQDRAASEIATRKQEVAENLSRLESRLIRLIRLGDRDYSAASQKELGEAMKEIREKGGVIPVSSGLKFEGASTSEVDAAWQEALAAQAKTEETFAENIKPHASTYIRGIELQIGRLADAKDPGAVSALQEEIEETKEDEEYFPALMSGKLDD
jgi:hypothetical protein